MYTDNEIAEATAEARHYMIKYNEEQVIKEKFERGEYQI